MATKTNIRSIRFSDELAQMIDLQPGRTFTEKFECLITKCCWELPGKEAKIEELNKLIAEKREQLQQMSGQIRKLEATLRELSYRTQSLGNYINQAVKNWTV